MTPALLRDQVAEALADLIGNYEFSGGQTTPAIRIDAEDDSYPEQPKVTGLEVVIRPEFRVSQSMRLAGDRVQTREYQIVLKQWDRAASTRPARDRLLLLFDVEGDAPIVPRAKSPVMPRSQDLTILESCTLTLEF